MAVKQRSEHSRKFQDLTGLPFDRWTVLHQGPNSACGKTRWHCVCSCGTKRLIISNNLKRRLTKSCGCHNSEVTSARNWVHGYAGTVEHKLWKRMVQSCENPKNPGYDDYGGRGIRLYPKWRKSFVEFLSYVGLRPSPKHSLDRYPNNDGNYEPGNVRWATQKEQCRNTRRNRLLTLNDKTACLAEWSEIIGISSSTLQFRLRRGWSVEKTLTTPNLRKP